MDSTSVLHLQKTNTIRQSNYELLCLIAQFFYCFLSYFASLCISFHTTTNHAIQLIGYLVVAIITMYVWIGIDKLLNPIWGMINTYSCKIYNRFGF